MARARRNGIGETRIEFERQQGSAQVVTPQAERFRKIVSGPDENINLAEAALLVAAGEYPDLDINGYLARINELSPEESDATLKMLYAHVMQPKYAYTHHWSVGDVLLWDHLGTWHCALADYAPNEYRLMKRCQVMADKVFDPAFLQEKLRVVA